MGLYDRDYTQADFQSPHRHAPQMRMSFPKLTPVVKWLLIINIGVFLAAITIRPLGVFIYEWFELDASSRGRALQVWRLISYQFLHAPEYYWHIFMNMLGLFFFGPMLERFWGSKKFLIFYLVCGATGGVLYPILAHSGWLSKGPLVGASGSLLGILAAGAILFPNLRVYVMGIFPIKLMFLAIIIAGISIITLLRPDQFANAGGQAAHLGGMAAGAAYVFSQSWRDKLKFKLQSGHWEKQMASQRNLQAEVDRILSKVNESGIQSLTSKEKKTLKEATKSEQLRNRF